MYRRSWFYPAPAYSTLNASASYGFALSQRWPVISSSVPWGEAGALLSYSADVSALHRRAAHYVDRILKGAKPADLPIEQPTKYKLVLNMKTAKLLGLEVPRDLRVRTDRVIE